jgi:hypothetical protein
MSSIFTYFLLLAPLLLTFILQTVAFAFIWCPSVAWCCYVWRPATIGLGDGRDGWIKIVLHSFMWGCSWLAKVWELLPSGDIPQRPLQLRAVEPLDSIFGIRFEAFLLTDDREVVVLTETWGYNRETEGLMDLPGAVGCCSVHCGLWAGRICMRLIAVLQMLRKCQRCFFAYSWSRGCSLRLRKISDTQTHTGITGKYLGWF